MRSCVAKVLLSQAHSRFLSFAVWTVNNETEMLHVCIYFSYLSLFLSSSLLFPLYSHIYFAIGCESRSRRDHHWVSTKLKKAYHFQIQQPRNEEHFIGIKSIHDSCDSSINLDSLDFLDFLDSLDSLDFLDFKFWFLETPSHHLILKIEHIACACCGDRRCMYQSETLQLMYQQLLTKVRTHPSSSSSSSSLYHLSPSFSIPHPSYSFIHKVFFDCFTDTSCREGHMHFNKCKVLESRFEETTASCWWWRDMTSSV